MDDRDMKATILNTVETCSHNFSVQMDLAHLTILCTYLKILEKTFTAQSQYEWKAEYSMRIN